MIEYTSIFQQFLGLRLSLKSDIKIPCHSLSDKSWILFLRSISGDQIPFLKSCPMISWKYAKKIQEPRSTWKRSRSRTTSRRTTTTNALQQLFEKKRSRCQKVMVCVLIFLFDSLSLANENKCMRTSVWDAKYSGIPWKRQEVNEEDEPWDEKPILFWMQGNGEETRSS